MKNNKFAASDFVNFENVDEKTRHKMEILFAAPHKGFWVRKRAFDIIISLGSTLILWPFYLLIALIIFIDDPHGSPLYKQKRIGRHGEVFYMYKFRTMVVNADAQKAALMDQNEADGPAFKMKNDPRITRFGRFLRKASMDELMQIPFNVLPGSMSFVGPRPPLPEEFEQYDDYQKLRLVVTPGLTCYWQATDNRNDVAFNDWIDMDIQYITKRNLWLDTKLIFKTVGNLLKKDGR